MVHAARFWAAFKVTPPPMIDLDVPSPFRVTALAEGGARLCEHSVTSDPISLRGGAEGGIGYRDASVVPAVGAGICPSCVVVSGAPLEDLPRGVRSGVTGISTPRVRLGS